MVRPSGFFDSAIAHLPVLAGFARMPLSSPWQDSAWRLAWVRPLHEAASADHDARPAAAEALALAGALEQVSRATDMPIHRDEAEGYWLNLTASEPSIFVLWRNEDGAGPQALGATLSYNEAGRWMDAGETVDRVPMPADMAAWLGEWVRANYEPQRRKRQRGPKPSFMQRDEFARFAQGEPGSAPSDEPGAPRAGAAPGPVEPA